MAATMKNTKKVLKHSLELGTGHVDMVQSGVHISSYNMMWSFWVEGGGSAEQVTAEIP